MKLIEMLQPDVQIVSQVNFWMQITPKPFVKQNCIIKEMFTDGVKWVLFPPRQLLTDYESFENTSETLEIEQAVDMYF